MKLMDTKKYVLSSIITSAIFGIILGVLLLVIPTDFLLNVVFIIMGIVTILNNIPTFTMGIVTFSTFEGKVSFFTSLLSMVIGFVMIFWRIKLLLYVLGAYLILMPVIDILFAEKKVERLKAEIPKLILGAVMLLLGPAQSLDILFDIAGWVVIALTVIYVISMMITMKKKQNVTGSRVFADTDGDGTIDTVYVDTTGDGKADTAIPYDDRS